MEETSQDLRKKIIDRNLKPVPTKKSERAALLVADDEARKPQAVARDVAEVGDAAHNAVNEVDGQVDVVMEESPAPTSSPGRKHAIKGKREDVAPHERNAAHNAVKEVDSQVDVVMKESPAPTSSPGRKLAIKRKREDVAPHERNAKRRQPGDASRAQAIARPAVRGVSTQPSGRGAIANLGWWLNEKSGMGNPAPDDPTPSQVLQEIARNTGLWLIEKSGMPDGSEALVDGAVADRVDGEDDLGNESSVGEGAGQMGVAENETVEAGGEGVADTVEEEAEDDEV